MQPGEISAEDYNYVLPPEKIAQVPAAERDHSKLLIYEEGKMSEDIFLHISNYLPEKSKLIFNDTKVIRARIFFLNEHRAGIEIFLLEPVSPFQDMQLAVLQQGNSRWRCLIGNAKKWREEKLTREFRLNDQPGELEARMVGKIEEDFLVEFSWQPPKLSLLDVLDACGSIPLPPYIKRKSNSGDESRYQTIYAFHEGSVAVPTAGLHFTENVFQALKEKKIQSEFMTLHVGAGTFRPVKSKNLAEHVMHHEQMVVKKEMIQNLLNNTNQTVIAVGTTSLRALESLYWIGQKILLHDNDLAVRQWQPYESNTKDFSGAETLNAILDYMQKKELSQFATETQLLIVPGYSFKLVDALITNFHLPKSTLLLLIAAFIGDDWKKVYDHALKNDFRFLSYGDGSLLWKKS